MIRLGVSFSLVGPTDEANYQKICQVMGKKNGDSQMMLPIIVKSCSLFSQRYPYQNEHPTTDI